MQRSGQCDVHEIHVRIGQQLVELGVCSYVLQIHLLAGGPKVALNAGPISGAPLFVARANRRHASSGHALIRKPVNPPHESDAGQSNAYHRGASSGERVDSSMETCRSRPSPRSWNNSANRIITKPAI